MTRTAPPTGDTGEVPAAGRSAPEEAYPLTALQNGMLFHSELRADSATYHDLFTLTLRTRYDRRALEAALAEVVTRHPVLRTSFNLTDFSEPLQLVHGTVTVPVTEIDLTGHSPDEGRQRLLAWREEEKRQQIDWTVAPLLRVFVHRLPDGLLALTLSFHHAILDGWSVATLVTELMGRYAGWLADSPLPVNTLPVRYRDFVAAERAAVATPEMAEFWQAATADIEPTLLPRQPGYPTGEGEDTATVDVGVDEGTAAALAELARRMRVPQRTVLLAAHLRVLALLGGTADVTTGMVTHARPEHELADQVLGLFLNTVPVRVRVDLPTWRDLVRATFEAELTTLDHRAYPLFEIQRVAGRSPLFETLFDYRDFHVYDELPGGDQIEIVGQDFFEQTNLPFAAGFSRSRTGALGLRLTYNRWEFPVEQMDRMARLYRAVLAALLGDPEADPRHNAGLLAAADLTPDAGWNRTETDWPGPETVPELVAASVAATPEATALVWRDNEIRYGEFGAGVNQLAHELTERGVGIGDTVGVLLERGPELVTAVHAVLAAGAAYLPLDPELPPRRLALMCSGARLVITTEQWRHLVPDGTAPVLLDSDAAAVGARSVEPLRRSIPPNSPAYVIYTSGSTGTPKAVVVDHAAIANRLRWMQQTFHIGPDDRVVHKTPFGFDVSVWELCWPLTTGAGIALAEPDGHRDSGYLGRLFAGSGATTVHFVPSMLEAFLADADAVGQCAGLRRIVCSGEALPPALADRCHELLPTVELHNLYGPTEAAIDVSWHRCRPGERPLPIGAPIANTRLYVLDPAGEQSPVGTPGDLCIAGVQLAQGYAGRPGLTAGRFRPDPFGPPGQRLYVTGDRARWLPGGEIEYLGRSDDQVKVRGMRIEPGEVEAALAGHPAVRAAAVVVRDSAYLVAHVVAADPDEPPAAEELRDHLTARLPAWMVPARYQFLDALPTTRTGKLDRAALPEPDEPVGAAYRPPRDQVEARMATIWQDLLGRPAIGIDDDFFALGGHSLLALRLAVRIRAELGRELPVTTVLTAPTIRQLAAELRRPEDMGTGTPLVALRTTGDRPPLFLSHALGGQVFRYRPLAGRLGDDQPVYTIPARGLGPGEEPHDTLDDMVEDYVRYIRAVRPHGPYLLGGFCIGGNIALEVGRRLRDAGEEVPLVFPVWSSADEPVVRSSLEDETMLMIHALAGGVDILETVDLDELRAMRTEERLAAVIDAAAREQRLRPDTADLDQARRYLRVFQANARAVGYHKHEPYEGDVVLLQPTEDPEIVPGDDFGWRSVVSGRFAIAPLPGTRFTSVYEPLVADMAAQIRRWTDNGFPADENDR